MKTAEYLYNYFEGKESFSNAILADLFGFFNWTKKMEKDSNNTIGMFLGVYKGLYLMDIPWQEIHRCFLNNKLDDLIHIKYSLISNSYYKKFSESKIKIGNTFFDFFNEEKKTERVPFIFDTIQPPYHYYSTKTRIVQKSLSDNDCNFTHKIEEYKLQDKESGKQITDDYVTVTDIKNLLLKQENKCYVCADQVITCEWQPYCLYQFTLDRIDNKLPHIKNNVLICCLYCNCYAWQKNKGDVCLYKLCTNGCHKIKREITRRRNKISQSEIELLLN